MKKFILISICLLLFLSLKPNEIPAKNEDQFLESYATAEDIILNIIKPDVEQILRKKYGENFVRWNYRDKEIVDLKLVHEQLDPRWFEITVSVIYKFKNNEDKITDGQAHIKLKVLPPAFSRNKETTEIEFIDMFNIAERVD